LTAWAAGLVACLALVLSPALAWAADVVYLKDGTKLEGTIERETDSAIFLVIAIGDVQQHKLIRLSEIDRIERDASSPVATAAPPAGDPPANIPPGATRVAFITLSDTVGPYFNKNAIEHSIDLLKKMPEEEKPQVVVFWIDSGGGALFELVQIMPYLTEEVKPHFRTVAWIRSAISAAAMSAWPIEEMYMMREGNIGACTGYSMGQGGAKAMAGEGLEWILMEMEKYSLEGEKDPLIMRAMQVYMTLTCDIDEEGRITWYEGDQGEHLVNRQSDILTLNSIDAVKYGVARGIADTKDELCKAMGLVEWVEVGQQADEYQVSFRKNVKAAEVELIELWQKLNIAVSFAGSAPSEKERDRQIGIARRYLKEMKAWVNRAPSLEFYFQLGELTPEFFRNMDQQLKDLARPQ
jgi:membrane-bound ClpP family serine protease